MAIHSCEDKATGVNKVGVASSVWEEKGVKASATTQILLPGPYQAEPQLFRDASYINTRSLVPRSSKERWLDTGGGGGCVKWRGVVW